MLTLLKQVLLVLEDTAQHSHTHCSVQVVLLLERSLAGKL